MDEKTNTINDQTDFICCNKLKRCSKKWHVTDKQSGSSLKKHYDNMSLTKTQRNKVNGYWLGVLLIYLLPLGTWE